MGDGKPPLTVTANARSAVYHPMEWMFLSIAGC
jgi:hypothetical protein